MGRAVVEALEPTEAAEEAKHLRLDDDRDVDVLDDDICTQHHARG
jgi:hypothetical protein